MPVRWARRCAQTHGRRSALRAPEPDPRVVMTLFDLWRLTPIHNSQGFALKK